LRGARRRRPPRIRPQSLGLALAIALFAADASAARADGLTRAIDYLTIAANEGGSSGGHAAIRFGDETYHFQHDDLGLVRSTREDSREFLAAYAVLQNRSMHVGRIAVSEETYGALRDAFNERFLAQTRDLERLESLRRDRDLLSALVAARDRRAEGPLVSVPAAGFFLADASDERPTEGGAARESPALARLRDRVARERGAAFLSERRAALARDLASGGADAGELPRPGSIAARYLDRFAGVLALDALERALPLRANAYRAPGDGSFALADDERAWIARFADDLEASLARLAASERPGWSRALIVGMARLAALRESLDSNRLVVLDAYPANPLRLDRAAIGRQRDLLPELVLEARDDLATARASLPQAERPREADWTRVETAANRVLELERAASFGDELRVAPHALVPSRPARRKAAIVPDLAAEKLARALAATNDALRAAEDDLRARAGYGLVARNCVTEIWRVVDETLGGEAVVSLGGRLAPGERLTFIPIVSGAAVSAELRVVAEEDVPSYRALRLAALAERDGDLPTRLRESTTFSSTISPRPGERDSFFVFFTDGLAAVRPVLGAANLAAAVGASVAGVAVAPVDGGRLLWRGLRGAFFSAPELAFVAIRKGSFDFVPRRDRPEPETLDPLLALAR